MKKFNKLFTLLLTGTLLAGCNSNKDKTASASITDSKTNVATSGKEKTSTLGDLYNTLYTDSSVMENLFATIAKQELLKDMTEDELNTLIAERRQELLEENIENEEYQDTSLSNGVVSLFNEKLFVRSLRKKGYSITCANNYGPEIEGNYSYKDGTIFKCDYSDYFAKELDNSILKTLLIEKYIKVEKPKTLTKNKTVKVKYLSIPSADYETVVSGDPEISYVALEESVTPAIGHYAKKDSSYIEITSENSTEYLDNAEYTNGFYQRVETETFEKETGRTKQFMIEAVKDLLAGITLEDIEEKWQENIKKVEQYTYNNACPFDTSKLDTGSSHASVEDACGAYTNNGAYSDDIGLKLKLHEIEETKYVHDEVIDSSATILNSDIITSLFSDNVEEKLYSLTTGSTTKYLISSSKAVGSEYTSNDIIVNDSSNSYYYIIQVELINGDLNDEVASEAALKDEGAHYLAENNSSIISAALEFYLTKYDIKVHDEAFYDYLDSTYPKIEFDY